jgi:hypothetical protein
MALDITTAFVNQYTTNVQLLLQQKGSRLREKVMVQTHTGEAAVPVEQVGSVAAQAVNTRHSDTPIIATPQDRRWVFPQPYNWGDLLDQEDRVRMLIDPQSPYAQAGAMALGRAIDLEVIKGIYNPNQTGHQPTSATVDIKTYLSGAQLVGIQTGGGGTNVGMNVEKLKSAMQIFMQNEVDIDNDPLYMTCTAVVQRQLLNEAQAISLDFNARPGETPVLVEGKIMEFMGFEFIRIELNGTSGGVADNGKIPCGTITASTSGRYMAAWAYSGVHCGLWEDIKTYIYPRGDKNYSTQVLVKGMFGGTRLEEKKVVLIDALDT